MNRAQIADPNALDSCPGILANRRISCGPPAPIAKMRRSSNAATGSYYYDGLGPYATGCVNGSYVAESATLGDGAKLYLYYSPSCRTVWAGIEGSVATTNNAGAAAAVHRPADGGREYCSGGSSGHCHTAMLYDGGFLSYAHGTDDPGYQTYSASTSSY